MSSDSSATVRADSGEPPAKRQKTFDYGPDIVLLQAFNEEGGSYSVVAHVPTTKYLESCNARGSDPCYESLWAYVAGVDIKHVRLRHHESLVRFYAHWINERNAEAALEICQPKNVTWPIFACSVLRFWHDESLHHDLHDAVVDFIIGNTQSRRQKNWSPVVLTSALYNAVETIEQGSQVGTNFTKDTRLRDLLATLYLHHRKDELTSQDRVSLEDRRLLDLKHDIKVVAMSLLLEASTEGDFSKFPKDILAHDFDQHCRYHLHGDKETCYKQK